MTWLPTVLTFAAIVLVSLQGYFFFERANESEQAKDKHHHYPLLAGSLNLFLAAGGLIAFFLFTAGSLIASPEYGVVLVQGTAARIWLCLLLPGMSVGAGLAWQAARRAKGLPICPGWVLLFGIAIGIAAVTRFDTLNPDDPEAFCIRFYDMWWPFLLGWFAICLSQWMAATVEIRSRLARVSWAAFFVTGISFVPVYRVKHDFFHYGDCSTFPIWKIVTVAGTALFMGLSTWMVADRANRKLKLGQPLRMLIAVAAGASGSVSAVFWIKNPELSLPLRPWLLWALWIVIFAVISLRPILRRSNPQRPNAAAFTEKWKIRVVIVLGKARRRSNPRELNNFGSTEEGKGQVPADPPTWPAIMIVLFRRFRRRTPRLSNYKWKPNKSNNGSNRNRKKGRIADDLAIAAMSLIGLSLADMCHFLQLDPVLDLAGLLLGWMVLLELIAGAPLESGLSSVAHGKLSAVKKYWSEAKERTSSFGPTGARWIKAVFSVDKPTQLIARVLLALLLLIVTSEIPDAGKTIVHPFSVVGLPDQAAFVEEQKKSTQQAQPSQNSGNSNTQSQNAQETKKLDDSKSKYLGQEISDRVANTLAVVGHEVEPHLFIPFEPKDRGEKPQETWPTAVSEEADGAKSMKGTIEITGTKFPLESVVAPLQEPVRRLLKIREIRGSIQWNGKETQPLLPGAQPVTKQVDGTVYLLLASSSDGQAWQAEREPPIEKGSTDATTAGTPDPKSPKRRLLLNRCEGTGQPRPASDLELADILAYKIITSDPSLWKLGMASSWRAVQPFREGLTAWNAFHATHEYPCLTLSVEKFRQATQLDPTFALAQYRLGLALREDGQPGGAVSAFRASLQAYPDFVRGHVALADTLYQFDDYYYHRPPTLPQRPRSTDKQRERNEREARQLWRRVIHDFKSTASISDQAAAYAGLCSTVAGQSRKAGQSLPERFRSYYTAFFYCKRAEFLYSKLSPTVRASQQIKAAQVSALDTIGEILDMSATSPDLPAPATKTNWACCQAVDPLPNGDQKRECCGKKQNDLSPWGYWSCDIDDGGEEPKPRVRQSSFYTKYALTYYQAAMEISPEDWKARCSFAIDGRALAQSGQVAAHPMMSDLEKDELMRRHLADAWEDLANNVEDNPEKAACFYRRALDEYQEAVNLAPADTTALNNYAYALWEWRFRAWEWRSGGPDRPTEKHGEELARTARLLATYNGPTDRAIFKSTVAEVLLGEGDPDQAVKELSERDIPDHAFFDDIIWDLGEANLCARTDISAKRKKARDLFQIILDHESHREDQRFTNMPERLDVNKPQCIKN